MNFNIELQEILYIILNQAWISNITQIFINLMNFYKSFSYLPRRVYITYHSLLMVLCK